MGPPRNCGWTKRDVSAIARRSRIRAGRCVRIGGKRATKFRHVHSSPQFDLLVVGAGINGAGIARDAAGRGLKVLLVEQGDIAAATSQWSTKLIHGGLRYLEQYEFRLVRESLAEREVVLRQAPHIVEPLSFVLPHEPHLRPAWMLRAGLFLYDHLGRRETLPGSFGVDLSRTPWGAGLKPKFRKGFVYSDARVDDARLAVFNVMDARLRGADVRVADAARHRAAGARCRRALLAGDARRAGEGDDRGDREGARQRRRAVGQARARRDQRHAVEGERAPRQGQPHRRPARARRRARVHPAECRQADRVRDSVPGPLHADRDHRRAGGGVRTSPRSRSEEIDYLLELANTYLAQPLTRGDVVWTFSGIRPLYDDGASDPSAITRDYVFKLDTGEGDGAAALSIYGGKITTYRKLAEHALDELKPFLPPMQPPWTKQAVLPGGDLPAGGLPAWIAELVRRFPALPADLLRDLARRHGTRALAILGAAKKRGGSGRGLRPRAHRGRDRLPRARGMGAQRRRRALAQNQVRPRHDRRGARARRGVRGEGRRGACAGAGDRAARGTPSAKADAPAPARTAVPV